MNIVQLAFRPSSLKFSRSYSLNPLKSKSNTKFTEKFKKNEEIQLNVVNVINEKGEKLGMQPVEEVLQNLNLETHDLFLVNEEKFIAKIVKKPLITQVENTQKKVELKLKEKDKLLLQKHHNTIKELEINSNISKNDLEVKLNKAIKFLIKEYPIKITIKDISAKHKKRLERVTETSTWNFNETSKFDHLEFIQNKLKDFGILNENDFIKEKNFVMFTMRPSKFSFLYSSKFLYYNLQILKMTEQNINKNLTTNSKSFIEERKI
ncbi:hypothetical protein HDU92_003071 [Lobulomyces angularis]|nr:hypothetical protein HDU92_003071 [Lobulomyces angularis]